MCAQMLMHATVHWGCTDTIRESALKVDSGRKIPCRTGELNLPQRPASLMLYQLRYIPKDDIIVTRRFRQQYSECINTYI